MMDKHIQYLYEQAKIVMQRAYCPYSHYHVGVAISDGQHTFLGCNMENASYPLGQCAEANAIANMIATQGKTKVLQVCLCAEKEPVLPCGGCLQILNEFMDKDGSIITSTPQQILFHYTLKDLLPHSFSLY